MSAATLAAICEHYRVSVEHVRGPSRFKRFHLPRRAYIYVVRKRDEASYPMIGRRLGDRDHSTIIHAMRLAEQHYAKDPEFRALVDHHLALPKHCQAPPMAPITREKQMALLDWKPPVTRSPAVAFKTGLKLREKPKREVIHMAYSRNFTVDEQGFDKAETSMALNMRKGSQDLLRAIVASRGAAS